MGMLRISASFWRLVITYCRMGNFRAEGLGACRVSGVEVEEGLGLASGLSWGGSRVNCFRERIADECGE
jgi:hypothetical protein